MPLQDFFDSLLNHIKEGLKQVYKGEQITLAKAQKPRMRAQGLLQQLTTQLTQTSQAGLSLEITDAEVRRCAIIIIMAFLSPIQVPWDYDRFSESERKRRTEKFFDKISLGPTSRPCVVVDTQGKILMWYLPALLLPARVEQLNTFVMGLRSHLLHALQAGKSKSWRREGFAGQPEELSLGAGQLSISVGRFAVGHKRLIDPIKPSASLQSAEVQKWLSQIQPVESFLDAVLHIIHPELWTANTAATEKLVRQLSPEALLWPTSFTGLDLIVNRVTPPHLDSGGAITFYDHLLSLGCGHQATLFLEDLGAEFAYGPGTSAFLTGRVLIHSVPEWSGGERVVIAHYSKDDVHDWLGIPQPTLPTQLGLLALFTAST